MPYRKPSNPIELAVQPQRTVIYRRAAGENLRSNFLARFNKHFLSKPDGELFERIYTENPDLYFSSLVQLAKGVQSRNGRARLIRRSATTAGRGIEEARGAGRHRRPPLVRSVPA
jgi:hypothetical protein